jgi:hypothetical protein
LFTDLNDPNCGIPSGLFLMDPEPQRKSIRGHWYAGTRFRRWYIEKARFSAKYVENIGFKMSSIHFVNIFNSFCIFRKATH